MTRTLENSTPNIEDRQAVLFARGEEQSLEWFYKTLYPALSLFAFHLIKNKAAAEELVGDGFVKTWQQRAKLDTPGAIRAYLYTVVRNDCIRYIKKENRKKKSLREMPLIEINEETAFEKMVMAETCRELQAALQKISPGASIVLKLHFLEGKTLQEISRELGLSPSTIKTQKQRGLKALYKKMIRPFLAFLIPL